MKLKTLISSDKVLIRLEGELDHHSARDATNEIIETVEHELPRELVLDFGSLGFMDSSGIALILRVNRRLREQGGKMLIIDPKPQAYKVMEAAGIIRLIEVTTKGEVLT